MPQTLQSAWTRRQPHPTPLSVAGGPGEVSLQKVASFFPVASHGWLGAAGSRARQGARLLQTGPSRSLDAQRAGQGPFRLVLQALFVAAHDNDPHQDEEHRKHEEHDADRPNQPMNVVTEQVAPQPIERGPDDASGGIEKQEARPAHAVGAGQKGGPGPQHCHEAPEEDHFASMLQEQILAQFQATFIQADVAPVAVQQAVAPLRPTQKPRMAPLAAATITNAMES